MVGSDGCHVHRIHGDVEGIGGLLKQYHVPLAITEVTRGDCTTLAPTYKLNMTDEFEAHSVPLTIVEGSGTVGYNDSWSRAHIKY